MVSKAAGNRWQVTIKSATVDAEWESTVKKAAGRVGLSFADFIVHHSRAAAQAVLKDEAVPSAAVPVRLEDVASGLEAKIAALADEQRAQRDADREQLARIERASRRGRWRR